MTKIIIASLLALVLVVAPAGSALAVPTHSHTLCTPGEDPSIAEGVTENAPHDAFENFHDLVHVGQPRDAFADPNNPVEFQPRGGTCP